MPVNIALLSDAEHVLPIVPEVLPAQPVEDGLDIGCLDALAERWLMDRQLAGRTRNAYRRNIRRFVVWCMDAGFAVLDRAAVRAYASALEEAGYAVSTRNAYIASVRGFCTWCAAEGLLGRNPAAEISGGRRPRGHRRDAVSGAQIRSMMHVAGEGEEGRRNRALVALLASTGLRINEARMADVGDLRQQDGRDVIAVMYQKGAAQGEEAAIVPVPSSVMQLIRDMLADRPGVDGAAPLFCGTSNRNHGRRLSHSGIRKAVTETMRKAGAKTARTSVHSLRHAAATNALDAGARIEDVQRLLRHSSPAVTMAYVHDMAVARNRAADMAASCFMD